MIRDVLIKSVADIPEKEVALLLSAGMDSQALLFAALEANKNLAIYSFTLDDRESLDYRRAKLTAETFGCEFVSIRLPTSVEQLKKDVFRLVELGAISKTDFECAWAFLYVYPVIRERHILAGMGADGMLGTGRQACMHFRNDLDAFRKTKLDNPRYCQRPIHEALQREYNKVMHWPYLSAEFVKEITGKNWDDINRPQQKQILRDAFPEYFDRVRTRVHQNLQLGDSGIAEHFQKLLKTEWNTRGAERVDAIFNDIKNGKLKKDQPSLIEFLGE